MSLTAICACDPKGVIGHRGKIPWHCPEDLQHFRNRTWGHPVIMGRVTFESMPARAFEGRTPYILTKNRPLEEPPKGGFVIGGEAIFRLFFEKRLIKSALITHMHRQYEGDRFFPLHFLEGWDKIQLNETPAFSLINYTRVD